MFKKNIKYIIIVLLVGLFLAYGFYSSDEVIDPDREGSTLEGIIYELEEDRFLMAEGIFSEEYQDPGDLQGDAAYVTVTEETEIVDINGEPTDFENLEIENKVYVWVEGPLMESYPMQGEAAKIEVIEKTEAMKTYESNRLGMSLKIPREAIADYEQEKLKVTYVGPDSHMTEITDGFTLFVDTVQMTNSLEELATEKLEEDSEILEVISGVEDKRFAGKEGYGFTLEGGLGNEIDYFIYRINDKGIVTFRSVMDPNDEGYLEKVEEIVSTIDIDEDLLAIEDRCVVSGCSSELCETETMESTCEHLPGAECLRQADCRLVEEECNWVLSEEAARCFMEVEDEWGPGARDSRIGYLFEKAEDKLN